MFEKLSRGSMEVRKEEQINILWYLSLTSTFSSEYSKCGPKTFKSTYQVCDGLLNCDMYSILINLICLNLALVILKVNLNSINSIHL